MPFGQKKAAILDEFAVTLVAPAKGDPSGTDHLLLTPRPDSATSDRYANLHFWVVRSGELSGLPVKVQATKKRPTGQVDAYNTVEFTNPKLNQPIGGGVFKIETPVGFEEIVEPLRIIEPPSNTVTPAEAMMTVMLPEPTFPRLSVRLLPPYRYLLDEGPHPRRHPEGYAHGKPAPECGSEAQRLEAGRWWECAEYCWGVDLYNHGYWWEAHEAWEGVWACFALDHALRHALQCLIQVSAAHLQRAREILAGAQSLIQRSQRHLADSPGR